MATFSLPQIMKFTVMPNLLTAKAWLDPNFEDALIRYPRQFLLAKSSLFPRNSEYVVLRDGPAEKHFVIPFLATQQFADQDLMQILDGETGAEESYDEFLPPRILAKALTNRNFKSALFSGPNRAVEDEGLPCPWPMRVIENSERTFHIPLRFNEARLEDLNSVYYRLRILNMVRESTKCCASGTCNDDNE